MQMTAFAAVDYLVKSQGQPYNWEINSSSAERIGLAKRPMVLSENKTKSFANLDYEKQKTALNIIGYDFYFRLTPVNGNAVTSGEFPDDESYIVNAQRIVMYENKTAKVELRLWK
jgi:hypothetical protein